MYQLLLFCTVLLCLTYSALFLYYFVGWRSTPQLKTNHSAASFQTKVTVILPARNEEHTIEHCINSIAQQNYPKHLFQLIVVDDCSTDSTRERVKKRIQLHTQCNISLIELPALTQNESPKKRAIEKAVEAANGELIITTDADCSMEINWIPSLVKFYELKKAKLIVAPLKIKSQHNASILQQFQEYDCIGLVASGGASLHYHRALLCNGANLAFQKSAYLTCYKDQNGKNLASGDDMFLMLAIQKRFPKSIFFLKSASACVQTLPQTNFSDFIRQRKRWATKGFSYNNKYITWVAVLIVLMNLALLTTSIISFFSVQFLLPFLVLFLTKLSIDTFFLKQVAPLFDSKVRMHKLALFILLYPLLICAIAAISWKKEYTWKDRTLK